MYSVYINHFLRNNQMIDTEELMFSVPQIGGFPVSKPIVKQSEDSADNYSFTLESNSPYYDSLCQLKTIIRVEYDGDIIFSGRVLSIGTSTVYHTKNITCEGTFAFFNDSYYEGKQEKQRTKLSVSEYYTKIINNHNAQVPEKAINKGTVGVTLPTETDKYEPTSWTQSSSLISNLSSNYGGHMRIRYSGTTPYLDWYKYYARDLGDGLRPQVVIGKNILDISSDTPVDNVFTRVIPIGDTNKDGDPVYIDGCPYTDKNGTSYTHQGKYMPVTLLQGTNGLYTNNELTDEFHNYADYRDAESKYSVIYKTMSFSDATTKEKLWDYCKKWIKESYFGAVTQFTIKAIDMHIQNQSLPKILLGELVDVDYLINRNGSLVWESKKLVCKSVQYDLFNPENNSYTFGIPSDLLQHNKSNKKKKEDKTVSAAASPKAVPKGTEDGAVTWRKVLRLIGEQDTDPDYDGTAAYNSFKENGELSGTVTCYVSEEIPDHDIPAHKDKCFTAHLIGRITLVGRTVKWVAVSEDRGIFAYVGSSGGAHAVTHWYSQHTGYTYEETAPGSSTFSGASDSYAMMIAKDTNPTYGGVNNANDFISNGRIGGSVNCYDPNVTNDPINHPEAIFTAQIIGKFGTGTIKYVAISSEYGMFAYTHTAQYQGYPEAVAHWYMRVKGMVVDNTKAFIKEDKDGKIYATGGTGNIEDKKTVVFEPTVLTGQGSQGEMKVGYDLTSQEDKWKIEINIPIQYLDADGNPQTADGFVKASDFNIESIPSFKTKLAVVDVLIAGKVNAVDIEADIANLRKITSDQIWANTQISASQGSFTSIKAGSTDMTFGSSYPQGLASNYIYYKETSMNPINIMGKIVAIYNFNEVSGTVTLQGKYINNQSGSWVDLASFNMAATTFYQNAVAAATVSGWEGCYADIELSRSSTTISAGDSITIYPVAKATPTASHSSIITKGITITATGGGAPEVDLNGAGPSYTEYDSPPTTPMQKSGGVIMGHIWYRKDNGKWGYLRAFSISYPT